jgi:ADP-ribose pyrophosphatase
MPEPAAELPPSPSERGGEIVFESKRFRVVRIAETLGAGDGADAGAHASPPPRSREVIEHPGSVVVVPMVSPREVCLVEVVRVAVGRTLLELPAGTLDRVESLRDAAARELAEETGYRAGRIEPVASFWMSPGILRERMHLFVADELVPGPQALEPGEQITTRVVASEEAIAMCLDGRIDDAKTVAGLMLLAARRGWDCGRA